MNKLKIGFKSAYGRNRGRISSYHRQRGNKKVYKIIDFGRTLFEIQGKVKTLQYDAYRNSKIAGIAYTNGLFSYMLAVEGLKLGDWIFNTQKKLLKVSLGVSCQIKHVTSSQKISNLEYYPGSGGKISRSAGTFSKIINRYDENALIKLKSGEFRLFFLNCMCTLGRVDNLKYNQTIIGKAGINRLLGWRPIVRGRAMNPVDHPHGGRTNGGISPRTPWGQLTRGIKTVKKVKPQIIKKEKNNM